MSDEDTPQFGPERKTIILSPEAYDALLEELNRPPEVNEKLLEALQRHRAKYNLTSPQEGVKGADDGSSST